MATTRKIAQEKIKQAIAHIDKAGQDLYEFRCAYEAEHPELSIPVDIILQGLLKTSEAIEMLLSSF